MTAESIDPQLRRNSLGLPELIFQSVTHIAPATNMVFTYPIIALKAGPDMPLSFLLATTICFFIGNTVAQFSRYMPSSGGYYSFATRGLGPRIGFMATWSYLVYELLGGAGSSGFLGYLLSDTLQAGFRVHIPWWLIALLTFAVIWTFTHYGVQLSVRITLFLGGLELLIMLALATTFLIHPGPGSSYIAPLNPSAAPHHLGGVLAGMVFSILSLSGFEGSAPLAQESRRAGKFVGQAVLLSLVVTGLFYVSTSYASAIGWGTGDMAAFAAHPNPYYALGHKLWGMGWWFVVLALINSAVSVGLATTNSASRVMYTMGRAGTLPSSFGRVHPAHQTPTFAIAMVQIVGIAAVLLVGLSVAAGLYLRTVGDHRHAGGDHHLLCGEPGADGLHPPRASRKFQHLAARGFTLDRHPGAAAGAIRDHVPRAGVAVQHRAVLSPGVADRGIRLYAMARITPSRGTVEGRNHAGRQSQYV